VRGAHHFYVLRGAPSLLGRARMRTFLPPGFRGGEHLTFMWTGAHTTLPAMDGEHITFMCTGVRTSSSPVTRGHFPLCLFLQVAPNPRRRDTAPLEYLSRVDPFVRRYRAELDQAQSSRRRMVFSSPFSHQLLRWHFPLPRRGGLLAAHRDGWFFGWFFFAPGDGT
jgi:hypothetical protein